MLHFELMLQRNAISPFLRRESIFTIYKVKKQAKQKWLDADLQRIMDTEIKKNKKQENSEIMLTVCRNAIVQTIRTPFFQANLGPSSSHHDLS